MAKLKEFIEILGGQIISRVQCEEGKGDEIVDSNRRVIVAKTINDGIVDEVHIEYMNLKVMPDENKLTKEGDIVVKLSKPYSAALINKEHEGMLVSSFCSIIRNVKNINPKYLVAYLNSDVAEEKLASSVAGSTMSILSNGKINDLDIVVPSEEKQKLIGDFFEKSATNKILMAKIIKLENEKLSSMIYELENE